MEQVPHGLEAAARRLLALRLRRRQPGTGALSAAPLSLRRLPPHRIVSVPTLVLPADESRAAAARDDAARDDVSRADAAPDRATPARGLTWRWAAWDVALWTLVALLFAGQSAARTDEPFLQQLVTQLVGFVPCMLFTPLIGAVALRYRFSEGGRGRAAAAHLLCLAAFLAVGGAMMGALEWSLPWHPAGAGLGGAMRDAVVRYYPIDTLIY